MSSASSVNEPAIAWTGFQYLQGQPISLDDVRRNNSILVLEQWATYGHRPTHTPLIARCAALHCTALHCTPHHTSPATHPSIERRVPRAPHSLDRRCVSACSWCPPCRSSIPHLNSLYQQYHKHGVDVLGVTNETDAPKLRKFIQSMGVKMTYPVAIDADDVMAQYSDRYRAQGIPHAYIVDWTGRVRWQGHPMAGLGDKLDVLVNERKQHLAKQGVQQQQHGDSSGAASQLRALSDEELTGKTVKELMAAMRAAGIDTSGCIEKSDLIDRIKGKPAA